LHPGWWARLVGEGLDLQTLADSVRLPEVEVRSFDGRYYLCAEELQAATDEQSGDAERRAEEIVRVLNGAARVEHGNHREVHVDAAAKVREDGSIQHFVHLSGTIAARDRMSATLTVDGEAQPVLPPPSRIEQTAAKAFKDANAERALRIFGRDDLDYRDLYYVFEIVREAIEGDMFADGTVTRAEVDLFRHTAQSPTALGDAARHGSDRGQQPPAKPMPFDEARGLVRRILRIWLMS
jgi:hypothetical protein